MFCIIHSLFNYIHYIQSLQSALLLPCFIISIILHYHLHYLLALSSTLYPCIIPSMIVYITTDTIWQALLLCIYTLCCCYIWLYLYFFCVGFFEKLSLMIWADLFCLFLWSFWSNIDDLILYILFKYVKKCL